MKSKESFRAFGDLNARRRLHQSSSQSSAPARHRPPMAATETPTACPDVRLVDCFDPPSAGTAGIAVAETCVSVEEDVASTIVAEAGCGVVAAVAEAELVAGCEEEVVDDLSEAG
jgi:hypothetical protein